MGSAQLGGLLHLQGCRHAAGAQPCGGMGTAQHPRQLHRAGDHSHALLERPVGRPGARRPFARMNPLRRLGDPDDCAGVAVLLAARAGNFITGQTHRHRWRGLDRRRRSALHVGCSQARARRAAAVAEPEQTEPQRRDVERHPRVRSRHSITVTSTRNASTPSSRPARTACETAPRQRGRLTPHAGTGLRHEDDPPGPERADQRDARHHGEHAARGPCSSAATPISMTAAEAWMPAAGTCCGSAWRTSAAPGRAGRASRACARC